VTCSNCGTENRVGAKFCMECATRLAAGSTAKVFGTPPPTRIAGQVEIEA
jgi:hypothetical protein